MAEEEEEEGRRRELSPPSPGTEGTKMSHQHEEKHRKAAAGPPYGVEDRRRAFCAFLVVFLLLAGITALTVWLIYRPHKPKFTVVSVAVYDLNVTSPPFMSATMQFTVVTRNPNKRVSFYYDQLYAQVSYKNQAITAPVALPPLYHETKSTVALSPVLGGGAVPVSAEVANGMVMDEAYGVVALRFVLMGKLKYKAGAIRTRRYGAYVRCDVLVGLKRGFVGQVPLLGSPDCKVDV